MAFANEFNPTSQPAPAGRVEYSPSDLMAVLNELAHELNAAKPGVLSKDIKVNRDVVLGLVDELRNSMPVAVEQADVSLTSARQQLTAASQQAEAMLAAAQGDAEAMVAAARSDAEAMVVAARTEADAIVSSARQKRKELIENEGIVAGAKIRAGEIVSDAQAEADRLMADADAYCDNNLAKLGEDLAHLQHQVAAGRARLAQRQPTLQNHAQAQNAGQAVGQLAGHSQPMPQGQAGTQNRSPQVQPSAQPKQSRIAFGGRR